MSDKEKENKNWRFGVVGNIVEQHTDENGIVRRGTKAYPAGTKVYLYGLCWDKKSKEITVIGLNRFKRFALNSVPCNLIKNVRCTRIFKPKILEMMDYYQAFDGMYWWGRTSADKRETEIFVEEWNSVVKNN